MRSRSKYVAFDIETLGLVADSRIVSYCLLDESGDTTSMCCDCTEEEMLEQLSVDVDSMLSGKILVTYNGENFMGGFDIPLLRTRYAVLDMVDIYPFSGVKHIDLLPIFQKKFNTSTIKEPEIGDLNASQCKELIKLCGMKPASTKALNIEILENADARYRGRIASYVDKNMEHKIVSRYGLKHCYHLLFGGEIGTTGEDVLEMWENGQYSDIAKYNKHDCEMTMDLLKLALKVVPDYDLRYFVL